jgi:hypothetical protein
MPGKTDIRWSDSEWAVLERLAELRGMRPGQLVKAIVRDGPLAAAAALEIGSAAPREGEFAGLREAVLSNGANVPLVGAAEEATAGPLEPGKRVDVATPRRSATAGAAATPVPSSPRPPESAGSTARPPAGGSAADSSAVAEPAVEEPVGVRLLDAVVAALRAQGVVNGVGLMARKVIRSGQVDIEGEVCRDPERLVDPASLGAPS